MGIRFQKRINLGKGFGINISKSGITPSLRTKSGSISTKGFSIKTGVPGVTYQKRISSNKSSGCMVILIIPISILIIQKLIK